MAKIFTDLSYNNRTLKPIGRPVDDLAALYEKKEEDYNYVVDSLNKTETALNQIQHHTKDAQIVKDAQERFKSTLNEYTEAGDFENRTVDVKNLANDLANKHGLLDVQRIASEKQAYLKDLQERLDNQEITRDTYQKAVQLSELNYQGLTKDPTTGKYMGNYNGVQVQNTVKIADTLLDVMDGFKANKIALRDSQGRLLKSTGQGYLVEGTDEYVAEEEIQKAAWSYMMQDPDIQSQIAQDLMFEKELGLRDEQGNKRAMTAQDLQKVLMRTSPDNPIVKSLGITKDNINDLDKVLEENNVSPEAMYDVLRKEQIMNEAMTPAVLKYGYKEEDRSFHKEWMAENAYNANQAIINASTDLLHVYESPINLSADDLKRTAESLEQGKANLLSMQTQLKNLEDKEIDGEFIEGSEDANTKAELQQRIEAQTRLINQIEEQQAIVFDNEAVKKELTRIKETSKELRGIDMLEGLTDKSYIDLIYSEINGTLKDEDIRKSIKLISPQEWKAEKEKQPTLTDEIVASRTGRRGVSTELDRQKQELYQDYQFDTYEEYVQHKVDKTREYITSSTTNIVNTIEKSEKDYATDYHTVLYQDMSEKDRRNHPLAANHKRITDLSEQDSNFYTKLSSVYDNIDIASHIAGQLDIDKEDVLNKVNLEKAKIIPTIDYRMDYSQGKYRPVVLLRAEYTEGEGNDKTTRTITVPSFYDNPHYDSTFQEDLRKYRDNLVKKHNLLKAQNGVGLNKADQELLRTANLNLYNTLPYSADIDLLNLHNVKDGSDTTVRVNENTEYNVRAYTVNSPGNNGYSFYITDGNGANAKFIGFDENDEVVELTEQQMRSSETTSKIRNGKLKMLGADSVRGLKMQFADMTFMEPIDSTPPVNPADLIDLASTNLSGFFADGKDFESTMFDKNTVADAEDLTVEFPNIKITDVSRVENTNVQGSAENSAHKRGKALDLRANGTDVKATEDALKIANLSDREKRKRGIKSAEVHGEGLNKHVHIIFD